MKKIVLIVTAPLLLIDACSSVRLARKENTSANQAEYSIASSRPASSCQSKNNQKQIVVRELSNGDPDLSMRFEPVIKDHYRKEAIQVKVNPEE